MFTTNEFRVGKKKIIDMDFNRILKITFFKKQNKKKTKSFLSTLSFNYELLLKVHGEEQWGFLLVWTSQTQHLTRWTSNQDPAERQSALLATPHNVPSLEGHRITWLPERLTRGAAVLLASGGSCISKAAPWPAGCCCRRSRTTAHSDRRHFENSNTNNCDVIQSGVELLERSQGSLLLL